MGCHRNTAIQMDVERGDTHVLLFSCRDLQTHYLITYERVDTGDVVKCIAENDGEDGVIVLEVEETDGADPESAEVELDAGDWQVTVYGQNSGTNLDVALTTRQVHSELIRVN